MQGNTSETVILPCRVCHRKNRIPSNRVNEAVCGSCGSPYYVPPVAKPSEEKVVAVAKKSGAGRAWVYAAVSAIVVFILVGVISGKRNRRPQFVATPLSYAPGTPTVGAVDSVAPAVSNDTYIDVATVSQIEADKVIREHYARAQAIYQSVMTGPRDKFGNLRDMTEYKRSFVYATAIEKEAEFIIGYTPRAIPSEKRKQEYKMMANQVITMEGNILNEKVTSPSVPGTPGWQSR